MFFSRTATVADANHQAPSNRDLCVSRCFAPAWVALSATSGAISGAIGYGVMTSAANWVVPNLSQNQMAACMALAGALDALITSCCIGKSITEQRNIIKKLVLTAIIGAAHGALGAAITGLTSEQQLQFASASGAAGNAILFGSLASFTVICCCRRISTNEEQVGLNEEGSAANNPRLQMTIV
jgi:hypothetical protein